jgi:hypothetical protein
MTYNQLTEFQQELMNELFMTNFQNELMAAAEDWANRSYFLGDPYCDKNRIRNDEAEAKAKFYALVKRAEDQDLVKKINQLFPSEYQYNLQDLYKVLKAGKEALSQTHENLCCICQTNLKEHPP